MQQLVEYILKFTHPAAGGDGRGGVILKQPIEQIDSLLIRTPRGRS